MVALPYTGGANVGHVQFQPTAEEIKKYGLKPAYGHIPKMGLNREHPEVSGTLNTGDRFNMKGVMGPAVPFDQDKQIDMSDPRVISRDLGPLTPEQAEILKNHQGPPNYETTGTYAPNCVQAAGNFLVKIGKAKGSFKGTKYTKPEELVHMANAADISTTSSNVLDLDKNIFAKEPDGNKAPSKDETESSAPR